MFVPARARAAPPLAPLPRGQPMVPVCHRGAGDWTQALRASAVRLAVYENLPPGGALRTSYEIGLRLMRKGHTVDLYRLSTYSEKGPFDLPHQAAPTHLAPYRPFLLPLTA